MNLNTEALAEAAKIARGLSIDAVHACSSGHLGLPLGAAEMGAVLYGHALRHNPDRPRWINRDRFVLSAGHGSMFLYGWLHLSGYGLPLEEIKNFRQLHSMTPGHPEFMDTPGVEATTGPLGQGVGNGVGMALAGKMAAARFNTDDHTIFDYRVVVLAGDGCLQEGVAAEASAFAGHFKLDNLILVYDSNDVTLDAMARETQSEDTLKRYEACGFEVQRVDGHNMAEFLAAFEKARNSTSGKPQFIEAKTEIARGIPEVAGTAKGHGEGGAKFAEAAREGLGLPKETFYVSDQVKAYFTRHKKRLISEYETWEKNYQAWRKAHSDLAEMLDGGLENRVPADLLDRIEPFAEDAAMATRKAGAAVIQPVAQALPLFISGSADLHGSTNNYIQDAADFKPESPAGRNIRFGIREHGMGAILNGVAYDGLFRPSGATFLVFSDYCRPSIRLAALSRLPVTYIFTHDSVGVGEDGPTHQPVEMVSSLRLIPNLDVIRPADPEETAGAYAAAMERTDGPTALILTRQNLPNLNQVSRDDRRKGVLCGGYIARKEKGALQSIILASGSELQHALVAAEQLGDGARVVSLPSTTRFDRQPESYREEVLPASCRARVAIEAGATAGWYKYVGLDGKVIGIDRFGLSAPGAAVMKELGITPDSVVAAAKD